MLLSFFEDIRSIIIHFLRLVGTISIILTLNFSIVILVLFTSIISGLIEKRALKYVNDKEQEKSNIETHYNYYSKGGYRICICKRGKDKSINNNNRKVVK